MTTNFLWYILPPTKHFWRWSKDGTALEWMIGSTMHQTVCMREELEALLAELADEGLPSLDLIVTLIHCIRSRMFIRNFGENIIFQGEAKIPEPARSSQFLINKILTLPEEWHNGRKRTLLLRILLKSVPKVLDASDARLHLRHFSSVSLPNPQAETQQSAIQALRLLSTEEAIRNVFQQFANIYEALKEKDLLSVLKAGVSEPPEALDAPLPEPPDTGDLIQELLKDPQTAGIARLTLRIQAAARIPMHNAAAGDIRVGGVSDITNKGDISALLLSELAQDDEVLVARLAHQEALYLRRESPPIKRPRTRLLLIDSTLLSWGEPRLFAMSVALSAARQTEGIASMEAFMLGEKDTIPATLSTRDGIMEALTILDRGTHGMTALERVLSQLPPDTETIFITQQESLDYTLAGQLFPALKKSLKYYYLLDRNGGMRFFQVLEGNSRMIAQATFPLPEILFGVKGEPKGKHSRAKGIPPQIPFLSFYNHNPSPLLYPPPAITLAPHNVTILAGGPPPEIAVFHEGDIIYWNKSGVGGQRIFTNVPPGMYFMIASEHLISLLVYHEQQRRLILCRYEKKGQWRREIEYTNEFFVAEKIGATEQNFVLYKDRSYLVINATNGLSNLLMGTPPVSLVPCASHAVDKKRRYGMGLLRSQDTDTEQEILKNALYFLCTQNVYSLQRPTGIIMPSGQCHNCLPLSNLISITKDNGLKIGKYVLKSNIHLMWLSEHHELIHESFLAKPMRDKNRPQRRYLGYQWKNGMQIILDSAGFVHLLPSINDIPQVTILYHKYYVAAWASTGQVTGSPHYLLNTSRSIPTTEFYEQFIHPIIREIANN